MENKKELILGTIKDIVSQFLYYDRKEDTELSIEDLKQAIKNNDISIDEIVDTFKKELNKNNYNE